MSRAIRIATFGALLALVLSACTSRSGSAELDDAIGTLNEAVESLTGTAESAEQALHDLEARLVIVEDAADEVAIDFGRVGPSRAGFLPQPPEGLVTVQFIAEAVDGSLPGEFRFFLAPDGEPLFDTRSLEAGEAYDVGMELEDGVVFVEPGVLYSLKVVYENPENNAVSFLVPGGTLDPQAALPFVRNRCWCASLEYSVPALGTFTRVIEVGVGPDTPSGARAVMVWPVVRTTA
jgi:hypothetical protein